MRCPGMSACRRADALITGVMLVLSGVGAGNVASAAAQTQLPAAPATGAPNAARTIAGLGRTTPLAFRGITVIDVRTGRLLPDQTVVVAERRIRRVGPTRRVRVPAGAQLVDARGKYLIPGLWDMHVHQGHWGCYWDISGPLFLANGITGVREAYTPHLDSMLQLRRGIAAGTRIGPRQIVAGPALIAGTEPSQQPDCEMPSHSIQGQAALRSPADARHVVDSLKAAGADFIKTRMSGIADERTGMAGVPPEEARRRELEIYFAAAAEARRVGIRFEGHMPWGMITPMTAADSGQRIIDHEDGEGYCWYWELPGTKITDSIKRHYKEVRGDTVSPAACRRLATHLRRHQVWLVPTIGYEALDPAQPGHLAARPRLDSALARRVERNAWQLSQRAGLPFIAGSDVNGGAGFGPALHAQLVLYQWAGLTPLAALQTATLNPALAYQATDSLGTVEPGKLADLVLLDANPLDDIMNVAKIQAVVANGRYFDRAALDSLRDEARQAEVRLAPYWAKR